MTEDILNVYVSTLESVAKKDMEPGNEKNPTFYNNLYHLDNFYRERGSIPTAHFPLLKRGLITYFDRMEYNNDPSSNYDAFLEEFLTEEDQDEYGGNDSYSMYILAINTFRRIMRYPVSD